MLGFGAKPRKYTHYCPQCGAKYFAEVYCEHCRIKVQPVPKLDDLQRRADAARRVA